ncbi:MAG: ferritin [Spirochaetales bacterium]|nr:ferritin [Spirochaetales bacterium]
MLNKKVSALINEQINKEFYSAYLYLDFANYYYDLGLDGFAKWYDVQAGEERDHAMKLRDYMIDNGERVTLDAIEKPNPKLESAQDPLKLGLEHERYVTALINKIYKTAIEVDDYRTMQFLDWYVKEQCEEEKNAEGLLKKYELFGHDAKGLYSIDKDLAARQ